MNLRTLLIALTLAALAGFAALNWPTFIAPTALNLGFADVQAPLGLVMLGVVGLVVGLFRVFSVYQLIGIIGDSRRSAKELKLHRELADKAEASRFVELRAFIDTELRRLDGQAGARDLGPRIDRLEQQLRDGLAALDSKLDRAWPAARD
ncbi:MAG: LapA family protein [Rubrivivax sp.]|nr:LapA family protein [Rubrivivax sp.]